MGRFRIKIHPNLDESLLLKNWEEVHLFLSQQKRDLVLEIGSGMGEFLAHEASKRPNVLFLGLDFQRKRVLKATELVWKNKLDNIRFMQSKVDSEISDYLAPFLFSEIFIMHPDPWSKRRQKKRRIVREDMFPQFHRLLKTGGILWISTDHREYAQSISEILKGSSLFRLVESVSINNQESLSIDRVLSRFEKKLMQKGFPSLSFKAVSL